MCDTIIKKRYRKFDIRGTCETPILRKKQIRDLSPCNWQHKEDFFGKALTPWSPLSFLPWDIILSEWRTLECHAKFQPIFSWYKKRDFCRIRSDGLKLAGSTRFSMARWSGKVFKGCQILGFFGRNVHPLMAYVLKSQCSRGHTWELSKDLRKFTSYIAGV